jgi:hypothetical protein
MRKKIQKKYNGIQIVEEVYREWREEGEEQSEYV